MTDSTAPIDAERPVGQGFCSPADWRDEVLYSVMLDRFSHARFRLASNMTDDR